MKKVITTGMALLMAGGLRGRGRSVCIGGRRHDDGRGDDCRSIICGRDLYSGPDLPAVRLFGCFRSDFEERDGDGGQ